MNRFNSAPLGLRVLLVICIIIAFGWVAVLTNITLRVGKDLSENFLTISLVLAILLLPCAILAKLILNPTEFLRPLTTLIFIPIIGVDFFLATITEEYGPLRFMPIALAAGGMLYLMLSDGLSAWVSNPPAVVDANSKSRMAKPHSGIVLDGSESKGPVLKSHGNVANARWQQVSIDEAKNHPLYGVRGWLVVFAISLGLGFLRGFGEIAKLAAESEVSVSDLLAETGGGFILFTLLASALQVGIIYYLMFSKSSLFRNASTAMLLLGEPLVWCVGAAMAIPGWGRVIAESGILWLISCGIWITYLQRSRRVRVTFENTVQSESIVNSSNIVQPSPLPVTQSPRAEAPRQTDESLWEQALNEIESSNRVQGLWAKSFAEANGDENKAKAIYLKARVSQLTGKD